MLQEDEFSSGNVASRDYCLEELEQELSALRAAVELRDKELSTLGRYLVQLQSDLDRSEARRERLERVLSERNEAERLQIGKLMNRMDELVRAVSLLRPVEPGPPTQLDFRVSEDYLRAEQEYRAVIAEQLDRITSLQVESRRFYLSRSWRVTAPLRWVRSLVFGDKRRTF